MEDGATVTGRTVHRPRPGPSTAVPAGSQGAAHPSLPGRRPARERMAEPARGEQWRRRPVRLGAGNRRADGRE